MSDRGYDKVCTDERESKRRMDDLESVLDGIGSFGLFQILLIIIANISDAPASWGMLFMTLGGATPDWWCFEDSSIQGNKNLWSGGNDTRNGINASERLFYCPANGSMCPNLTFSNEFNSLISEWNLVCSQKWAAGIITTIQMVGVMLGAMVAGQLGDLIGRKKSFFLIYFCLLLTTLAQAFANSIELYTAIRFFVGICTGGVLLISFVIPVEYIGSHHRVFSNVAPFWAFGMMIHALVGYLVRDWRMQAITLAALGVPYLFFWWFVPESARWLIVHGKFDEAETILQRIAKINRKPPLDIAKFKAFTTFIEDDLKERNNKQKYTLIDLFRSWKYLKKTIILVVMWFSCGLVYYGLSFGVKNLPGDRYVNMAISGAIDIPSYVAPFVNFKFGRKRTSVFFMALSTIASFGIPILWATGNDTDVVVTALSLLAKFSVNGAWMVIMLFTSEHYPTVVRTIGPAVCNAASRVGAMLAPLLTELHQVSPLIPYLTFGTTTFVAIICILMLKETKDQSMPDYLPPPNKEGPISEMEVEIAVVDGDTVLKSDQQLYAKETESKGGVNNPSNEVTAF